MIYANLKRSLIVGLVSIWFAISHTVPVGAQPLPDFAANSWLDYQIVWRLGDAVVPKKNELVKPFKPIYSVPLLPQRLFLTEDKIATREDVTLLAANTQLVVMESKLLIACSLSRGPKGSIAEKNRVCLIDENSDGEFDNYFLRAFRSSLYSGEGHKFALAGRFENAFKPITLGTIKEIDPKSFSNADMLKIYFANISDKKQQMLVYAHVDTLYALGHECNSHVIQGGEPSKIYCPTAAANIRVVSREGKALSFEVVPDVEKLDLRFQYIKGMLDYRVTGFLVYPREKTTTISTQ